MTTAVVYSLRALRHRQSRRRCANRHRPIRMSAAGSPAGRQSVTTRLRETPLGRVSGRFVAPSRGAASSVTEVSGHTSDNHYTVRLWRREQKPRPSTNLCELLISARGSASGKSSRKRHHCGKRPLPRSSSYDSLLAVCAV